MPKFANIDGVLYTGQEITAFKRLEEAGRKNPEKLEEAKRLIKLVLKQQPYRWSLGPNKPRRHHRAPKKSSVQ